MSPFRARSRGGRTPVSFISPFLTPPGPTPRRPISRQCHEIFHRRRDGNSQARPASRSGRAHGHMRGMPAAAGAEKVESGARNNRKSDARTCGVSLGDFSSRAVSCSRATEPVALRLSPRAGRDAPLAPCSAVAAPVGRVRASRLRCCGCLQHGRWSGKTRSDAAPRERFPRPRRDRLPRDAPSTATADPRVTTLLEPSLPATRTRSCGGGRRAGLG